MPAKNQYSQLVVQNMPHAGILIRFRSRKIIGEKMCAKIRHELESLIAPERLMLIDFSNVEQLDSGLLGSLIATNKLLVERAGDLSVCGLRGDAEEFFRITRLTKLFRIYPNLEAALSADAFEPS